MTTDGKTIGERVAVIEEQMTSLIKDREKRDAQLEGIEKSVNELLQEISRYKGFIGGILFLVTSVAAFFKTLPFIQSFFKH